MSIALTKTLDPEHDYPELAPELEIVDRHFTSEREQHPHRRFEYAMALRACKEWDHWQEQQPGFIAAANPQSYDVGGAGSPFHNMLANGAWVIDPAAEADGNSSRTSLAEFMRRGPRLGQAVFCLSVLEHVENFDQFLYHLACLVAPGGLLFLTMDCESVKDYEASPDGKDHKHFHWMRHQIFTPYLVENLIYGFSLMKLGFTLLGEADWSWHGAHVFDYSFASLALVKRP